jgi:single-strand DNA-binding protein
MNKVILIGRITKDIELKYTSSNIAIAQFNLAIKRDFKNTNGEYESDFINCVAYKNNAELLDKYCFKGSLIAVEGRIQTRNYDGKDGKKIYVTEVITSNIQFLDTKKEVQASKEENKITPEEVEESKSDPFAEFGSEVQLSSEDLPF